MYCTVDNKWKSIYTVITLYLMAYCATNCMNNQNITEELMYNIKYLDTIGVLLISLITTSIFIFSFKKIPLDERHTEINKSLTLLFIGMIVLTIQRDLLMEDMKNNKELTKNIANNIICNKNNIEKLQNTIDNKNTNF